MSVLHSISLSHPNSIPPSNLSQEAYLFQFLYPFREEKIKLIYIYVFFVYTILSLLIFP
jgi:RsiW-degrading membrane proteinase PrsW (M82 family)